jgi:hypothetical protein
MGLTKRRMEAMDADVNSELRLCAGCGERVEFYGKSWQVEYSFTGPFTTVWLCTDCTETLTSTCVRCQSAPRSDAPICDKCLPGYESEIVKEANEAECSRCGCSIPMGEWDTYHDSGMCGWCEHMSNKEDRVEVVKDEQDWNPENKLPREEKLILTPEEFKDLEVILATDPRLIAYLVSHPEELYRLSPRGFEELIAELLNKMGYKVRLGARKQGWWSRCVC